MNAWQLDSPVRVSRWQQGLTLLCYIIAVLALWVAYIPVWLSGLLSVCLVMMFWFAYLNQNTLRVIRLSTQNNQWFVYLPTGQRLKVTVKSVMLWRYLVILRCSSQALDVPYQLVLFPDSLQAGDYRKLQARLRLTSVL